VACDRIEENQMKKTLAALLIAAGGASLPSAVPVALAQGTMLAPGIYTTPDISRRCQRYTRARVPSAGAQGSEQQSVFLACVQKLYRDEHGGGVSPSAAAPPPLVSAPVAMATDGAYGGGYAAGDLYSAPVAMRGASDGLPFTPPVTVTSYGAFQIGGPIRAGCVTDEGFGRTGSCDTP
jgi:hypothetical protein